MKNDLTHIILVVDRSGSMTVIQDDMEGGVNSLITDQASQPGECRLTYAQFDTQYEVLANFIDIKEAKRHYRLNPRGGTALLDAIGRTISEVGRKIASLPEHERPAKVLMAIVTDGEENSSQSWTLAGVRALIKQQQDQYNWEFTYLGANQDAIKTGQSFGLTRGVSMDWNSTDAGTKMGMSNLSSSISQYRNSVGGQSFNYSEEQRLENAAA